MTTDNLFFSHLLRRGLTLSAVLALCLMLGGCRYADSLKTGNFTATAPFISGLPASLAIAADDKAYVLSRPNYRDMDRSAAISNIPSATNQIGSLESCDALITCYNDDGSYLWARSVYMIDSFPPPISVASSICTRIVTGNGRVVVCGVMEGTGLKFPENILPLDNEVERGPLTPTGFLAMCDADGSIRDHDVTGLLYGEGTEEFHDMVLSANGSIVYVVGFTDSDTPEFRTTKYLTGGHRSQFNTTGATGFVLALDTVSGGTVPGFGDFGSGFARIQSDGQLAHIKLANGTLFISTVGPAGSQITALNATTGQLDQTVGLNGVIFPPAHITAMTVSDDGFTLYAAGTRAQPLDAKLTNFKPFIAAYNTATGDKLQDFGIDFNNDQELEGAQLFSFAQAPDAPEGDHAVTSLAYFTDNSGNPHVYATVQNFRTSFIVRLDPDTGDRYYKDVFTSNVEKIVDMAASSSGLKVVSRFYNPELGALHGITTDIPILIDTLTPDFAEQNSGAFSLSIDGGIFENGDTVYFNGFPMVTHFISSSALTADITANQLSIVGRVPVYVLNQNNAISNFLYFDVTEGLSLTSVAPASKLAGSTDFTLTLTGTHFAAGAKVAWSGPASPTPDLTPLTIADTTITVTIPAAYVALPGNALISVKSGGNTSNFTGFTINSAGGASITSLIPARAEALTAFDLGVNGTGFSQGDIVRWDGMNMTTHFTGSSTTLHADITTR